MQRARGRSHWRSNLQPAGGPSFPRSETHVKASNGGVGLLGLHHLGESPHLLDAGGNRLGVWEVLEPEVDPKNPPAVSTKRTETWDKDCEVTWRSSCWSTTVRSDSQSERSLSEAWRQEEQDDVTMAGIGPAPQSTLQGLRRCCGGKS